MRHTADGHLEIVEDADREGELALRPGWPSMFRGYLGDEDLARLRLRPPSMSQAAKGLRLARLKSSTQWPRYAGASCLDRKT